MKYITVSRWIVALAAAALSSLTVAQGKAIDEKGAGPYAWAH